LAVLAARGMLPVGQVVFLRQDGVKALVEAVVVGGCLVVPQL